MGLSFSSWRAGGYANAAVPRRADPASLQQLGGQTMGTTWSLRFDNPKMLPLTQVREAVDAALARVVAQMSHWEPESDITRFNRAQAGSRHVLPREFAEVMACALRWAAASGGAIDPTIGPLIACWGFGPEAQEVGLPAAEALADARARVGWQRLAFDVAEGSLAQPGGIALDLSGIAKGFAVDHGVEALRALDLADFLFEIGGNCEASAGDLAGNRGKYRSIVDLQLRDASRSPTWLSPHRAIVGISVRTKGVAGRTPSIRAPANRRRTRGPVSLFCMPNACKPTPWPPC